MELLNKKICIVAFSFIMIIFPLCTFMRDTNSYLFYENRPISPMPTLSIDTVLSGEYMNESEKFFSDIFFMRNTLLRLNVIYERYFMNKHVVNNIIIDDDKLLNYHKYGDFYTDEVKNFSVVAVDKIKRLNDELGKINVEFYYVGVPEQMSYFSGEYPKYYIGGYEHFNHINEVFDYELKSRNVDFINIKSYFNENSKKELPEQLYLKNDHHYSFYGAFKTYEKIMQVLNENKNVPLFTYKEENIEFKKLDNPFMGSLSRKLGNLFMTEEKMMLPIKEEIEFDRYDNGLKVESTLMTNIKDDKQYVGYQDYMGGDIANTVIDTNREELLNILIYGDSFTNALEMLLYASFNQMHSIDFRWYNDNDILTYIKDNDIDIVLCVIDDTAYFYDSGNCQNFIN